jgi:hypothetical protein
MVNGGIPAPEQITGAGLAITGLAGTALIVMVTVVAGLRQLLLPCTA